MRMGYELTFLEDGKGKGKGEESFKYRFKYRFKYQFCQSKLALGSLPQTFETFFGP